jgi:hypothetical protein
MLESSEDTARQTLGLAGKSRDIVCDENIIALRVREASARSRMGRELHR